MHALVILPPLLAIAFVFWKRDVIAALLLAIVSAEGIRLWQEGLLSVGALGQDSVSRVLAVFAGPGNVKLLLFSVLIGALLALLRASGGVAATVQKLVATGIARTARRSRLLTMLVGVLIFVESNLSVLTAGILARGLFDRFGMSRAQLAYLIDSTSAPVCILILLNGWGAYVLGLLAGYDLGANPVAVLWQTVPLNFYALLTLALAFYSAYSGKLFGPLKQSQQQFDPARDELHAATASKSRYMVVPLAVLIGAMVVFMLISGQGQLTAGDGAQSMLYATLCAIAVAYLLLALGRHFNHRQMVDLSFQGMSELLPLVAIVLLSIALGSSLKALGTGSYIASLVSGHVPVVLLPALLFMAGAAMSFATGTSWGTFALLIPLGMPLVNELALPPALILAAILGGGIFGDHCSPMSDTTAVSSIASGCDLLEHVRTQLPYALVAGAGSIALYLLAGVLMTGG
ncbi:Na+/H+ antiporter NhaC family protein [Gallaecimonas sp. GXIMD1310]|uniref:Na+/H+ antiporter NhaC family protein n=1 Tax=Gallaecimonas sp. GXIMD1310 TaxID=3131926 RepID=UPI0032543A31